MQQTVKAEVINLLQEKLKRNVLFLKAEIWIKVTIRTSCLIFCTNHVIQKIKSKPRKYN